VAERLAASAAARYEKTAIDRSSLVNRGLVGPRQRLRRTGAVVAVGPRLAAGRGWFLDAHRARLIAVKPAECGARRRSNGVRRSTKRVGTWRPEIRDHTRTCIDLPAGVRKPSRRPRKVVVREAARNRIGQGIEFDYC